MNPLLDMASARPRRAKVKPGEEAAHFSSLCKDKDGFDVKFINSFKGRGVFSCRPFQNGDFLIEYRGEVITKSERENRQKVYHNALKVFMFDFRLNGQEFCVDAAKEDNSLGRLVNDDHVNPNCKMKLIKVDGKPHLCLFALKDISPGEEIAYDYSDSDWPWRCKISTEAETQHEDAAMTSESHCDGITQNCKHELVSSVVPSLDKCARCRGPFAPLKWIGVECKSEYFVLIKKWCPWMLNHKLYYNGFFLSECCFCQWKFIISI
nr:N-lysine methyltransferase KMT5A-A-like [Pseudochaenichthys georgianus]